MNLFQKKHKNGLTKLSYAWLKKLNKSLKKLDKSERDDLVNNYKIQIIDEIKQEKKERQIINSFESIEDITNNFYQELGINDLKVATNNNPFASFFGLFAKIFTLFWFWIIVGIIPPIFFLTFSGLTIGSIGGFFFSFAIFKVYSGFMAAGILLGLLAAWILVAIISFFIAAISQQIFYFCLKVTINVFYPEAKLEWMNRSLINLSRKMWWKAWTIILGLTIIFSATSAPLMLSKGGLGYNLINGIFDNSQLVMDDMSQANFETKYLTNPNEHIYLNLAGSQTSAGANKFVDTRKGPQVVNINGKDITIGTNDIAIVRQYNTSREYMKVNISKITAYNNLHMTDEELVKISGSQKTPDGEFCWEDIAFGFGINVAYYTVYSPYDKDTFDLSDFNIL